MTTIISLIESIISIFSFLSGVTFATIGYFLNLPAVCIVLLALWGFSGILGVLAERHISRRHVSKAK